MRHRKPRRFDRYRSNGRGHSQRNNGGDIRRLTPPPFSLNGRRNNFKNQESAEKLVEKYLSLAKEAQASGDKTLSESYYQHADHFMRIVEEKNLDQNKIKSSTESQQPKKENSDPQNISKIK
tara:strand:- start:1622 stop:1987 length:366 start_codon:yes stop_codon:yes gene_type:complete